MTKHDRFILKGGTMAEKLMATNYDDALSWKTKFHPYLDAIGKSLFSPL